VTKKDATLFLFFAGFDHGANIVPNDFNWFLMG